MRLFFLLCLSLASSALADIARPVLQSSTTKALSDDLATGAKTMKISAAGTLVWENGAGLTGASYLKAALGMGSVENTAVSTWVGSSNITTVGTITTGTWHGTAIADTYIASALTWNAKESPLTFSTGLSRSTNTITLATSGVTAASYGSATQAPQITVDAYGRITAASGVTITPPESAITFTDNTTGNASTSKHGYLPKLSGSSSQWLDGTGAWTTPPSGITIGSTVITGGTSGRILMSGTNVSELTLGSGVQNWLGTPTKANLDTALSTTLATTGANIFTGTQTTQAIIPSTDNTYDIGEVYPGKRFNSLYLSGQMNCWYVRMGPNQFYMYPGYVRDGYCLRLTNNDGTAGAALMLGLASASWAAIIPNGPELNIRLADDSGDAALTTGALTVGGGTKHTKIKSGVATLVGGTVTVSDANVLETGTAATSSRIFVTRMTDGGTTGHYSISRVNATSFTITSSSASDTSTVSWMLLNP